MTATLLDFLMILSLGILAGCGAGLLIGFLARKQKRDWAAMEKKDKITTILLILACSAAVTAVLAWYVFWFPVV
jgi:NhaP-type Na+/H+ or K+/H+ antiporter